MRQNHLLLLLIALGIAGVPNALCGQETPQLIRVRVESAQEVPGVENRCASAWTINLRPNQPTTLGLFLQNPGEEGLGNVTVKLVQSINGQDRVIATAEPVAKLRARDEVRLVFKKGKDAKDADKAEMVGPPFKFQLWIDAAQPKNFIPVKRDLELIIREPRDYVTSSAQFDRPKNKLSFKVKLDDNENLIGPHQCPVQLVLGPEMADTKKGASKQTLTGPKQPVVVFAENVAFAHEKTREGRVYLTVDNYERAFTYPVTLSGSGDLDELPLGKKVGARIRVPAYAQPTKNFPVHLELDGPLDADYRVELGLDRAGNKEQFQVVQFNGLRQQKIALAFPAAGGDLICKTEVTDWKAEFDTTGVFGNIWFRLNISKKDPKTKKYEEVEFIFPDEAGSNLAAMQLDVDGKRLFARVTQDDTKPEALRFVNLPADWVVGRKFPVRVEIRKRESFQAPIDQVIFYRGKLPADGKPPAPDAKLGVGKRDGTKEEWIAVLPPFEKPESAEITVQAITKAGVAEVKTGTIAVKDAAAASKGLATIKGKVAHGATAQSDLPVTLIDPKGKVKGMVKTNDKGEFVFENVAPGTYVVASSASFPPLVGRTEVVVPEGKELIENVAVRLLAK